MSNVARKRKRVPLWRAQLYMYRFFVVAPKITLPATAEFLLASIRRDAQSGLSCRVGERESAGAFHGATFAGLQRDWTKL